MERTLAIVAILIIPGILLIWYGLWLIKGGNKAAFMARHIYAGRTYMYIPAGIMALVWALATIPQSVRAISIILWIGISFGGIALVFGFVQPSILKPSWLKWLEQEHSDVIELLAEEVQKTGDKAWNERVKTQSSLENWVAEVRAKHGL